MNKKTCEAILTLGIDVGSSTSKCVVMKNGSVLLASAVIPAGTGTSGPARALDTVFADTGLALEHITAVTATGYGRESVKEAQQTISELSCHVRGAVWLCPDVRTVIDIGGQDCKAMAVSPEGRLMNFVMNDKCAAGTGRFLEVMARIFEIDIREMGRLDEQSTQRVDISSTCTVFAESEVISRLSQGAVISDVLAGIHRSVAVRAAGLLRRTGVIAPVFLSGGVAMNTGVVRALSAELGVPVRTHQNAQMAGAIGAALYAYDTITK